MKTLSTILLMLLVTCCVAMAGSPDFHGGVSAGGSIQISAGPRGKDVPIPAMDLVFQIERDSREWKLQFVDENKKGSLCELVPAADAIAQWKEMVVQQVVFTKESLRKYVDNWKEPLLKADRTADFKEAAMGDGSILMVYTSTAAGETCVRRFFKGKDGVYMLAYQVRPGFKKVEVFETWESIVRTASLIPNPEKTK